MKTSSSCLPRLQRRIRSTSRHSSCTWVRINQIAGCLSMFLPSQGACISETESRFLQIQNLRSLMHMSFQDSRFKIQASWHCANDEGTQNLVCRQTLVLPVEEVSDAIYNKQDQSATGEGPEGWPEGMSQRSPCRASGGLSTQWSKVPIEHNFS